MIHLGYEIGSGTAISVPLGHTAITGQSQLSGKTTALEALIHRSERRAIAFLTKRGEGTFQSMKVVPPYFSESVDWLMVKELLEAQAKTKLKFETSWIIEVSKGARSLADVKRNCEIALRGVRAEKAGAGAKAKEWTRKPATGMSQGVYTVLDAYLEKLLPQIESMDYTKTLELRPGLNVMDLTSYSLEMQGLVVRSVLEWVYEREKKVIVVIPEAWELLPQDRGSPVRLAAETYIRKGAVLENYLFLDSQDIAGVHKVILRQVGVWIMGVQREANEVMRTLRQFISKPARPKPDDLMELGKGQFFVCHGATQRKVYVQPHWMKPVHARGIATGDWSIDTAAEVFRDYLKQFKPRSTERHSDEKPSESTEQGGTPANNSKGSREDMPHQRPESETAAAPTPIILDDPTEALRRYGSDTKCRWCMENNQRIPSSVNPDIFVHHTSVGRVICGPLGSFQQQETATPPVMEGRKAEPDPMPGADVDWPKPYIDAMYVGIRARILADTQVLAVLARPLELRILEEPKTMQVDGETCIGQIGMLIEEGFFDPPKKGYAVWQELVERRRKKFAKPSVYDALDQVARLGFLVRDGDGAYGITAAAVKITRRMEAAR